MADASYAVTSFLGGELSEFASGRFDKPDYKISLNVCLNSFPVEIGPWVRRPGTAFAGTTKGGMPGRVISWAFDQSSPYTLEFTDGFLRFRSGTQLAGKPNDGAPVLSISSANPAVMTTSADPGWLSGNTILLIDLGTAIPTLQNRQVSINRLTGTTYSLFDPLTGATIDGSTLGPLSLPSTAFSFRIQELVTPYISGSWAPLRMVQAELTGILLNNSIEPQALVVASPPSTNTNAVFSLSTAVFEDGPYLDPFNNGVQAVPASTTGLIQLTLQFPVWSSSKSYKVGDFATSSSVNYESLTDQNVGNTPAGSPSDWAPVGAGAAINNGQGFLATDIGRLIRLYSEPPLWNAASCYSTTAVVTYNPTESPGQGTDWQALTTGSGNVPGNDLTHWELVQPGAALPSIPNFTNPLGAAGPAQWTWGKIVSLLNFIPGAFPPVWHRSGT